METTPSFEGRKFSTPEEELTFLRNELAHKERQLEAPNNEMERERIATKNINEYKAVLPEAILEDKYKLEKEEVEGIVLDLAPESHDEKMQDLLGILQEKGVKNALSVVDGMRNPHIEDDFHRFLVQYIVSGYQIKDIKPDGDLWRALHMKLYEIALPSNKGDREKELGELLSLTEQFYNGMFSLAEAKMFKKSAFSFEIAIPADGEEVIFYIGVPSNKTELFEKQILAIFPGAKVAISSNDYNAFNSTGIAVGSYAKLNRSAAFPIKTYDEFGQDPLNVVLSSFSKLSGTGEGAAMQIMFSPAGDRYNRHYKVALDKIQKGEPLSVAADMSESKTIRAVSSVGSLFKAPPKALSKEQAGLPPRVDEISVEQITNKIQSPIVATNVRLVASAPEQMRAESILNDLESSFNQLSNAQGNSFKFIHVSKGRLRTFIHSFVFRLFSVDETVPLSLKELTGIYHLSAAVSTTSRELRQSKAKEVSAPVGMPHDGVLLGTNSYSNTKTPIYFPRADRLRHFYTIGQTGTGKSTLLKNMIIQDIRAGDGVCFIDPHGSDINDVLASIPAERHKDVIYFDPSYTKRPMGLNMLEYDKSKPEQKTFVVNEMFSIFQKLYGAVPESMGPLFEQYFRNATMLVIEDPTTGNTLLDVSRVLADAEFRRLKLSRCRNPLVVQFWRDVAEKAGGESALANIVPYITSKFDVFLANDIVRPIVTQEKSAFDFRDIMDNKKILLVNLSKGRLGDINANLIGLIIVGKILMAALSRVDTTTDLPPFYLYIDEFQNITTPSISTILSEARKYKLSLNIAHQFIAQLDDDIRDAVFGNVGSKCVFRVGANDAEYLERQFEPEFEVSDLMNIDNFNAYLSLLVDGKPVKPFNIEIPPVGSGDRSQIETIKNLSYERYGKDREYVEKMVEAKYQKVDNIIT
ncbi:MAG: TraM recognition domain-containing protein [Parcubacteria group bacterium]|nr:TraM recognition domain-containing protein [Parcubacteria group bacterium]